MGTTLETLKALDYDGSGAVSWLEIQKFAKDQGLDEQQTLLEFKQLDANGDGQLGADEIGETLGDNQAPVADQAMKTAAAPPAKPVTKAVTMPSPVAAPVVNPTVMVASQRAATAIASASPAESSQLSPATQIDQAAASTAEVQELQQTGIEAEQMATRVVAEQFARLAQKVLLQKQKDESEATRLEVLAKQIRNNATQISQAAEGTAQEAARKAALAEVQKSASQVAELESKAQAAEAQATKLRADAAAAMANALRAKDAIN